MKIIFIKYLAIFICLSTVNFIYAQNAKKSFDDLTCTDLKVLKNYESIGHSIHNYIDSLISESWITWKKNYELRKSPEERTKHYKELKKKFIDAIGGLPKRTPLNPQIMGTIDCGKYKVEKILFQSMPDFYVTGDLFLPNNKEFKPPYPGVLIPCGHYEDSKAHDEYQSMGVLCALNGLASFVYDPIDQGERVEFRTDKNNTITWGTHAHNLNGIRSILLGRNIARFEIWDGMRSIDYLQSRKDINPDLIGVTGNSGGGTQTSYIMALDNRVKVAAPSCYIQNLNSQTKNAGGDAEQLIFDQLAFGMDHPDYVLINAPRPVKILAATHDFFKISATWETFRICKRYYTDIGYSENLDILENDAGHNYNKTQREGAIRWLVRYLLGENKVIFEPKINLLSEKELNVSPTGRVLQIKNAKSVFDIQNEVLQKEIRQRKEFIKSNSIDKIRKQILKLIGFKNCNYTELPGVISKGKVTTEKCEIQKLILAAGNGIYLPALLFIPFQDVKKDQVLLVSENGKAYHLKEIGELIDKGKTVLSVDLPGIGETKPKINGRPLYSKNLNTRDCFDAYLLGKSIVGFRTKEILTCTKFLMKRGLRIPSIELIADGEVGVPALHAAFLNTELYTHINISNSLESWQDVIKSEKSFDQLVNIVNGALKYYDLPDLVKFLGNKITIENPLNAVGLNINYGKKTHHFSNEPEYRGLAGVWYGQVGLKNPEGPDPVKTLDLKWSNKGNRRGRDWSAEWFGFIHSPFNGDVNFSSETNQNLEIFLNEKSIINIKTGQTKAAGTVKLVKDKYYPVRIIFNQDAVESSYVKIRWNWKGHPETNINESNLFYSPKQKNTMDISWR
jgi:hypothetical protein